jgi:hypothetical protein
MKVTKSGNGDAVRQLQKRIKALAAQQVLVGVPQVKAPREDDGEHGPMNNATLAYIHEHGSPAANIPARPFLVPGIKAVRLPVASELAKAARACIEGNAAATGVHLDRAGLIAQSSVRAKLSAGVPPPLQPETVARRHRGRGTRSMRGAERAYLNLIGEGASPAAAQEAAGIKPLVNTGQLRNAITYVVSANNK